MVIVIEGEYDKTVVYLLDVSGQFTVQQVALRGRDKPLSWDSNLALTPIVKDRLYRAVVTTHTRYKVREAKFILNGEFELPGKDNRRIVFGPTDTTLYQARFNVAER